MINKISKQIGMILKANFKKHRVQNTLPVFNELFYINNTIATLQNEQLNLLTSPSQH